MQHLIFFVFVIITSLMFSFLEIQSEGQNGWAEKFPTWRFHNKWTNLIMANRPLTGYHFYFFLFMISIAHLPYGLGLLPPSAMAETRILSFILFFFVLEDFLWFIMNPAYGITHFRPEFIWWHSNDWLWFMPRLYWIYTPIAIILYVFSYHI